MKNKFACIVFSAATASPLAAQTYNWTNLTSNGSLGSVSGYDIALGSNWQNGIAPTFSSTAQLVFNGLGTGNHTIYGGSGATRILNRITVDTASTLRFSGGSSTDFPIYSFQGTTPTIDVQSGAVRWDARISSTAGITKTGAGSLFFNMPSATSGFTGPLTIAQGTVTTGNNFSLGDEKTVNIQQGGMLNFNGRALASSDISNNASVSRNYTFNISGTGVDSQGAIVNNAAAVDVTSALSGIHQLNLTGNASVGGTGDYAIGAGAGGAINGNGHTLTKTGTNQIYVAGAASNISYQVSQGTLVGYQNDAALGGASGSVSVGASATLASDGNRTFANSLTLANGATLDNKSGSTTWSGNVSLSGGSTTIKGASASAAVTLSGVISGSGGITKTGANTLTLSNANTYTGATIVNSDTTFDAATLLRLSSNTGPAIQGNLTIGSGGASLTTASVTATQANQFGPNSVIIFNGGSGLSYFHMHADQVVAGLSGDSGAGGGAIEVNKYQDATNYGNRTLTVNVASGSSYSYKGVIRNADSAAASTLGITKSGAGAQDFTGSQLLYTGATHVNGGTLSLTGGTTVNSFRSNTVNIASGAILKIDGTGAGPADNATNNFASGVQFGQNATSANPMTLSGAGTFQVTGGGTDVIALGNTASSASGAVRISLSPGGLIHVQSGILRNGGYNATNWTDNKAGLRVDAGATFQLWDGTNDVRVDALTGAGTIGNGLRALPFTHN